MDKELRKLIKNLRDAGYDVTQTRGSHYLVTRDGERVATLAGTASDHRSIKNAQAAIRRYERSKKEN